MIFIIVVVIIIGIFLAVHELHCWLSLPEFPDVSALDILLEYSVEHVTFGLLYVIFTFSTRIFYKGVLGFATEENRCRGLTTCLLYVGPLFALQYNTLSMPYNIILYFRLPYFHVPNSALFST